MRLTACLFFFWFLDSVNVPDVQNINVNMSLGLTLTRTTKNNGFMVNGMTQKSSGGDKCGPGQICYKCVCVCVCFRHAVLSGLRVVVLSISTRVCVEK